MTISVDLWRRAGGFDETLPIWCDIDFDDRTQTLPHRRVHLDVAGTTERWIALRTGHVTRADHDTDELRYRATR